MSDNYVFPARYYGRCPSCGEEIEPGDSICYDDSDVVVHEECA